MSYDDGPDPTQTPRLLDHLSAGNATATFFVEGRKVDEFPDLVRREADEGHEVGNHSYDHLNLLSLDSYQVWRQIRGTTEALEKVGITPELFRPPYDAHDRRIRTIIRAEDLTMTLWSYSADPRDWEAPGGKGKPASEVCRAVVEKARAGDVILLHDRLAGTVEATPCILEGLRKAGLEPGRIVSARRRSAQNADSRIRVVR